MEFFTVLGVATTVVACIAAILLAAVKAWDATVIRVTPKFIDIQRRNVELQLKVDELERTLEAAEKLLRENGL